MAYQAKLIEEGSWRIFCRTFSLFPHSYRKVVTDRMDDQMSYLMAYQAKLIEEGLRCIFCRTFSLFSHSYQKVV